MTSSRAEAVRARVDIVEVVGRYVPLKKNGREFTGRCPFHNENTPSFNVVPNKGFYHCFGCGAHGDVIDFVQQYESVDFVEACKRLGDDSFEPRTDAQPVKRETIAEDDPDRWKPLLPVPDDAPELLAGDGSGWTVPIWNPKRGKMTKFKPVRCDAYRDAEQRLLGYVLRCEFNGRKMTPTITWCIGPDGAMQWCVRPFPRPRPLLGLDDLAARPDADVLLVEGEKCRAACAGALPGYAAVAWPGGGKGVRYVDWAPLRGRDVVMWPDADPEGVAAMLGFVDAGGVVHRGAAQHLHAIGVRSMRVVDTAGQPKGWDIADALDDGWTPRQLGTWAAHRVREISMRVDAQRVAR